MAAEIDDMVKTNGLRWSSAIKAAAATALVDVVESRARVSLATCVAIWPVAEEDVP